MLSLEFGFAALDADFEFRCEAVPYLGTHHHMLELCSIAELIQFIGVDLGGVKLTEIFGSVDAVCGVVPNEVHMLFDLLFSGLV